LQVKQTHLMILLTDQGSLLALIPMTLIYQLPLPSYADTHSICCAGEGNC